MKICTKCHQTHELAMFGKDRKRKDGLNPHCKYCTRLASAKWQRDNPTAARDRVRNFHANNPNRRTVHNKTFYDKNISAQRSRASAQRADKMREMYELAELCTIATGIPHEVDHIVPLQSPIVCGLHCEQNLQILSLKMNRAKSNRIWPDMP